MSVFKSQIKINPKGYFDELNQTQESVFNELLESAVSVKPDPKYGDDMHQIIYMENGDEYYFDCYKYIYPIKTQGYVEVINNNVGHGEIVSVGTYGENEIRVEHYINDEKMVRRIYECPENVNNLSAFLLQVGSLHPVMLEKLSKLSEVVFVKDGDTILGYDEQQNNIYTGQSTKSFFNDVHSASSSYMVTECKQK